MVLVPNSCDTAPHPAVMDAFAVRGATDPASPTDAWARLLAGLLLGACSEVPVAQLAWHRTPLGAPDLRAADGAALPWCVSVSHSHTALAVALIRHSVVGIDIEPRTRVLHHPRRLALRLMPDAHWAPTAPMADSGNLLRHWCLKEAYGKALGLGLRLPLHASAFAVDGDGRVQVQRLAPRALCTVLGASSKAVHSSAWHLGLIDDWHGQVVAWAVGFDTGAVPAVHRYSLIDAAKTPQLVPFESMRGQDGFTV